MPVGRLPSRLIVFGEENFGDGISTKNEGTKVTGESWVIWTPLMRAVWEQRK